MVYPCLVKPIVILPHDLSIWRVLLPLMLCATALKRFILACIALFGLVMNLYYLLFIAAYRAILSPYAVLWG